MPVNEHAYPIYAQCSIFIPPENVEPNVPFLYSLKTLENYRFSNVFRGFRNVGLKWVKEYFGSTFML